MNYLAHSILSFTNGQLVGNMIADFIKNNERENFPLDIQEGIKLHRAIDTFTDSHPAVSEAKKIFSPWVRLYSGAFVDVSFDYFVAHLYSEAELKLHSAKVYKILWENEKWLPENYKRMLVRMEQDDWLTNYRENQGIKFSMQNVLHKATYLEKDIPVFDAFLRNKDQLKNCFDNFYPDLLLECESNYKPTELH
ncbi:Acyl carrier protein phosphodiesterase [compost metagenome]